jgi:hypothetical protein
MLTLFVEQVLAQVRHHVVTPICLVFRCVAIHKFLEHNSLGDDSEHSDVTYAIGWVDHGAPFPGLFAPAVSTELRALLVGENDHSQLIRGF